MDLCVKEDKRVWGKKVYSKTQMPISSVDVSDNTSK